MNNSACVYGFLTSWQTIKVMQDIFFALSPTFSSSE